MLPASGGSSACKEATSVSKRIPLPGGKYATVDDADYERLSKYNWHTDGRYALRSTWKETGSHSSTAMHREIMGAEPGQQVDHINHDRLDNRRANLRLATASQNQHNRRSVLMQKGKPTTSKYKGVCFNSTRGKWTASARLNHKTHWFGNYENEVDAARAYDAGARELHGEFVYLNFPDDIEESERLYGEWKAKRSKLKRLEPWQRQAILRVREEVGLSHKQLARAFGVHRLTVKRVLDGA